MGIVDQMHRCDASHNTTVNVLAELYGGQQNFTFTEMDLRNRKAATTREERENDIPKLLEVKKLYKIHDGLKVKLLTIINHPLTPTVFESAWNELVDEYGIREDDTIQRLWESRKLWVAVYLKPLYCGRMTSIHRNIIYWGTRNLWLTLQPFDGHLSRVYTQAVYKKYREIYIYSTAFRIDPHPNKVDVYLVTHTDQLWQYAWFEHSFRVEAHYIMKKYMRGARTMVMWDRHEIVTSGPGCKSDQYKTKKLVEITMAIVRVFRKTSLELEKGCDTGCDVNLDNGNKKRGASGSLWGKMG
uniref:Protein FAR1-RELATED SEQUENCE n=1 Tax=Setaria viridis TaxID=4556 RepID=A0A4U6TPY2_SETVI|nr:hypothetical protein SEVIR_7G039500v2 [Setaria viridis]